MSIKQKIAEEYAHFAQYLVGRAKGHLPQGLSENDLRRCAMLALIEAVETFKPINGAKFESYASQKIKSAILNAIAVYETNAPIG